MSFLFPYFSNGNINAKISFVLSTSLGKMFLPWRFILDANLLFWLTISYQKPIVFSVSVFCSHIFTQKLNLRPKVGLTYAVSIVKWFFGGFLSKKIFLLFFAEFESLMFHNIIVKISVEVVEIWLQITTLQISAWFGFTFFTMGKKWKYLMF